MKQTTESPASEKSSGNVFKDLGIADASMRSAKVQLVFKIVALIKRRKLKKDKAAQLLKIDHTMLSALMNGKTDGVSLGQLMAFLTRLNQDIEIVIKPKPGTHPNGEIYITV